MQAIGERPQGPRQLKQFAHGRGGVEVIVHGRDESALAGRQVVRKGGKIAGRAFAPGEQMGIGAAHAQRGIQALPAGRCGLQGLGGEIERFAVVRLQHEQPQGHRADARFEQGADGGEVAERFAHLLPAHIHHAVVQPPARQFFSGGRFRLGDLVFVVGKDQIGATKMDVDRVAQLLAHHRRAFDVPAGTARAPG